MRNIVVDLGKNSYPIYIEEGLLNHASDYILKDYPDRRIMIISDDNVYPLYGDILERQFAEKTFCKMCIRDKCTSDRTGTDQSSGKCNSSFRKYCSTGIVHYTGKSIRHVFRHRLRTRTGRIPPGGSLPWNLQFL